MTIEEMESTNKLRLLINQDFNRIDARCAPGRIERADEASEDSDKDRGDHPVDVIFKR